MAVRGVIMAEDSATTVHGHTTQPDELIVTQLRDTRLVPPTLRRLLLPAAMLELAGILEGVDLVRQLRRGINPGLVTSSSDRDPASARLIMLTWWPAGIAALAEAAWLPPLDGPGPAWWPASP
jgi:hypothetical protein